MHGPLSLESEANYDAAVISIYTSKSEAMVHSCKRVDILLAAAGKSYLK